MENIRNMKENCGRQGNLAGSKSWYVLANAMGAGGQSGMEPILCTLNARPCFLDPLFYMAGM